jgi:hypothetical protein
MTFTPFLGRSRVFIREKQPTLLPSNSPPEVAEPLAAEQELLRVPAAVAVGVDLLGGHRRFPFQGLGGNRRRLRRVGATAPEKRGGGGRHRRGRVVGAIAPREGAGCQGASRLGRALIEACSGPDGPKLLRGGSVRVGRTVHRRMY